MQHFCPRGDTCGEASLTVDQKGQTINIATKRFSVACTVVSDAK
jgi:hypothetical protein